MIRALLMTCLAVLAVLAVIPAATAKGLEVGETIPAITAPDQDGKQQSFDSLKGSKGITLVFVRSVEWCPFCQRQVMDLSENAQKFKDAGYPVVTVSYDTSEKLSQFEKKFNTDVPMLADPRSEIIKSFGIFNENYAKGTMAYGTPYPGVYVVGADKKVEGKFFKEGVQDRPSVDELLASMKKPEPAPMDPADEFPQEEQSSGAPSYIDGVPPADPSAMPSDEGLMVAPEPSPVPDAVVVPAPAEMPEAPAIEEAVPPAAPEADAVTPPQPSVVPAPETPAMDMPEEGKAEEPAVEFMPPEAEAQPDAEQPPAGL